MPTCMSLVPGIVAGRRPGLPSAPTSCASTPRWPLAFEYHAMRSARRVRGEVRVVAVLAERRLVVVVRRRGREAGVDPRARACRRTPAGRASPRTVAAVSLAYDCAPSGFTWPGWSAQLAPPSGESAVFVSFCGSLDSVVRKPPQNARRPPGSTTTAALVKPVQPLWIGVAAPILPARRDRRVEQVLGVRAGGVRPDEVEHSVARPRQPNLVGAGPSGAVTRFHGAALAAGAAQTTIMSAVAAVRLVNGRSARCGSRPGRGRRR